VLLLPLEVTGVIKAGQVVLSTSVNLDRAVSVTPAGEGHMDDSAGRGDGLDLVVLLEALQSVPEAYASAEQDRNHRDVHIPLEFNAFLVGVFQDVLRSDHAAFWQAGYSAVLITDTANLRNPNYHCGGGSDAPVTLDYEFARQITQATAVAARRALDE
jgi:hypothetical protein